MGKTVVDNIKLDKLAEQAKVGDEVAMTGLWNELENVRKWLISRKASFLNDAKGFGREDADQELSIALMMAVNGWDKKKALFVTYFTLWGEAVIQRGIARISTIAIPENALRSFYRMVKKAEAAGVPVEEVIETASLTGKQREALKYVNIRKDVDSLDATLATCNDDHDTVSRQVVSTEPTPEEALMKKESLSVSDDVERLLSLLPEKDRKVIVLCFGLDGEDPRPEKEVAAMVGYAHEESVARTKQRAIKTLIATIKAHPELCPPHLRAKIGSLCA